MKYTEKYSSHNLAEILQMTIDSCVSKNSQQDMQLLCFPKLRVEDSVLRFIVSIIDEENLQQNFFLPFFSFVTSRSSVLVPLVFYLKMVFRGNLLVSIATDLY